jgi:hypothetical protein
MHEAKAFSCDIRAGRISNRPLGIPLAEESRPFPSDPIPNTPESAQPEGRQQSRWHRDKRKE